MISEGCEQCAKGGKMVMFVYGYCDQRDCFYCPLGENRKNVDQVYANERPVESDADVISNAADQRMVHLRSFAAGKNGLIAGKLLNEVSAARVRLLDPRQKAEYDARLRGQLQAAASPQPAARAAPIQRATPLPVASTPARPLPVQEAGPASPISVDPADSGIGSRLSRGRHRTARRRPWMPAAGVVGGLLAVGLVLALVLGGRGDPENGGLAQTPPEDNQGSGGESAADPSGDGSLPVGDRTDPADGPDSPPISPSAASDSGNAPAGSQPPAPGDPGPEEPPTPEPPPGPTPVEEPLPVEPTPEEPTISPPRSGPEPEGGPEPQAVSGSSAPVPGTAARLPVPDEDALARARAEIQEIYASELEGARSLQQKSALADEFIRVAEADAGHPASRYVLLGFARDLAAATGDVDRTLALGDRLGAMFRISSYDAKAESLAKLAEVAVKVPGALAVNERIAALSQGLAGEALRAGEIDAADRLISLALPCARKTGNRRLLVELQEAGRRLAQLKSRARLAEMARERLRVEPDNPKANLAAGQWECLVEGRWQEGLPLLAKGDDAQLAGLARKDLAGPAEPAAQFDLGEQYHDLAESRDGIEAQRATERAALWYRRASERASGGLLQVKIDKRLAELAQSVPDVEEGAGRYALEFDGGTDHAVVANFAYLGTSPITVEAIVKPQPPSGAGPVSGGTYRSSSLRRIQTIFGNLYRGGIGIGHDGRRWRMTFYYTRGTSPYPKTLYSSEAVEHGEWTHVAAVYNVREARLFVNGQLEAQYAISYPHVIAQVPFVIGGDPGGSGTASSCFQGQIKAIRVSNSLRYVKDFEPPENLAADAATVLLFPMSEGHGTRITSPVGRRITATIHGAEWVELE